VIPKTITHLGAETCVTGSCHPGNRRIHVVVAWDESANFVYVITAYIPDMEHFQENGIRKERE
jgi:hypothetical protein